MTRYHKAGRLFRLLGWLELVLAVLFVLAMAAGIMGSRSQPKEGKEVLSLVVASVFGLLLLGFAVLYLKVGTAIKEHKEWGRTLGIVLGCLVLIGFPIGTLIGAFALYYLLAGWNDTAA